MLDSNSTFAATLNGTTAGTGYDQLVGRGDGEHHQPEQRDAQRHARLRVPHRRRPEVHDPAQHHRLADHRHLRRPGRGGHADGLGRSHFSITYKGGTDGQDVVLTSLLATTTTVSPVTDPPVSGQSVTLTATVTPASGTGTPTGTVAFLASINGTRSAWAPRRSTRRASRP